MRCCGKCTVLNKWCLFQHMLGLHSIAHRHGESASRRAVHHHAAVTHDGKIEHLKSCSCSVAVCSNRCSTQALNRVPMPALACLSRGHQLDPYPQCHQAQLRNMIEELEQANLQIQFDQLTCNQEQGLADTTVRSQAIGSRS